MKKSTKAIFKAHGWRFDRAIHNYIYFKYYLPYNEAMKIMGDKTPALMDKLNPDGCLYKMLDRANDKMAEIIQKRYHAKILSFQNTKDIIKLDIDIDLGEDTTRRIIPYKYSKQILFNNPSEMAVMDCPCKAASNSGCELNCCIAVGQPTVDFWLEHGEKYHARKIDSKKALEIITRLRKTGHLNQITLKLATGGKTSVVCSCCEKCCGGGNTFIGLRGFAAKNKDKIADLREGKGDTLKGVNVFAPTGYYMKHDDSKCILCGDCIKVCNMHALEIENGQFIYDIDYCLGCGLCEEHCPEGANEMYYEDKGGILPLDLELAKKELEAHKN